VAVGSSTITAVYGSGTNSYTNTLVVTVHTPSYTDNFSVSQDYLAGGVAGSIWEGVYAQPGAIPGTTFVSDAAATNYNADANISSNGVLTVSGMNVGWEFDQNDGFFLFKYVPSDFQVAVHVSGIGVPATNYNNPGILARAFSGNGAPFDGTNGECWVSWTRFDQFGIGTYARDTIDNGTTQTPTGNTQGDNNYWLLMVRQGGTEFSFYQKVNQTDPWKPSPAGQHYSIANFAGVPMQVGLLEGGFDSGNPVGAQFDSFMLDLTTGPMLSITPGPGAGNVTISWNAAGTSGFILKSTPALGSAATWTTVSGTTTTLNGIASRVVPLTGADQFFRLSQ
jgi:hypothetical protein